MLFSRRTSAKTSTMKARHELRKEERKNKAAQIRKKKRGEILLRNVLWVVHLQLQYL
jgi:hypothetical protein